MTPEQLHLRDEILQVLYWLQGEGLGDEHTAAQFALWTGGDERALEAVLAFMQRDAWLAPGRAAGAYRFTPLGEAEGRRRFADAFADHGLGWSGPGGCGPDCEDCLIHGPEHCHAHQPHPPPDPPPDPGPDPPGGAADGAADGAAGGAAAARRKRP